VRYEWLMTKRLPNAYQGVKGLRLKHKTHTPHRIAPPPLPLPPPQQQEGGKDGAAAKGKAAKAKTARPGGPALSQPES
jgi:hypothetical protein